MYLLNSCMKPKLSEKTKAKPSFSDVNTAPALFSQLPSKMELRGLWPESKASPAAGLCSLTQEKQELPEVTEPGVAHLGLQCLLHPVWPLMSTKAELSSQFFSLSLRRQLWRQQLLVSIDTCWSLVEFFPEE